MALSHHHKLSHFREPQPSIHPSNSAHPGATLLFALHANGNLTWRDVQHLAVWTGEPAPLMRENGWQQNANGLWVNDKFGFGLMNADAFTGFAESWQTVPPLHVCTCTFPDFEPAEIFVGQPTVFELKADACEGKEQKVAYLEMVQVVVDVSHRRRGDLAIWIESPGGTKTKLLRPRKLDKSKDGLQQWPLSSVHTWSEDPKGTWKLTVLDKTGKPTEEATGKVTEVSLVFYGTEEKPAHYDKPREYDMNYNSVTDNPDLYKRLVERSHSLAKRALTDNENTRHNRRKRNGTPDVGDMRKRLEKAQEAVDALEELHDHEFKHDI